MTKPENQHKPLRVGTPLKVNAEKVNYQLHTDEGPINITMPKYLSSHSAQELRDFIEIMMKGVIRRSATANSGDDVCEGLPEEQLEIALATMGDLARRLKRSQSVDTLSLAVSAMASVASELENTIAGITGVDNANV